MEDGPNRSQREQKQKKESHMNRKGKEVRSVNSLEHGFKRICGRLLWRRVT